MNFENSKTSDPHRLVLSPSDKINNIHNRDVKCFKDLQSEVNVTKQKKVDTTKEV